MFLQNPFVSFLVSTETGEGLICSHLAHTAAGTSPTQAGKAGDKEPGKPQEGWKLSDAGVLSEIKLPATGKTEGLEFWQVPFYSMAAGCLHPATGPWAGLFFFWGGGS